MGLLTSKEFVSCHFYFPHSFVGTWLPINNALGEICHFIWLSYKAHLGFPNAWMHCSIHSIWCPTPFWKKTNIFTYAGHQIAQANSILTGYWRTILRNQSHGFPLLPHCPHFLTISRLSFLAFFAWSSWVKPHALDNQTADPRSVHCQSWVSRYGDTVASWPYDMLLVATE